MTDKLTYHMFSYLVDEKGVICRCLTPLMLAGKKHNITSLFDIVEPTEHTELRQFISDVHVNNKPAVGSYNFQLGSNLIALKIFAANVQEGIFVVGNVPDDCLEMAIFEEMAAITNDLSNQIRSLSKQLMESQNKAEEKNYELCSQLTATNNELINAKRLLSKKNAELEKAILEIQLLSKLIPICASCKKIRDDDGFWQTVESYISERSGISFSHGICPECIKKLYPEMTTLMKDNSKKED